jgi:hypothetical protein
MVFLNYPRHVNKAGCHRPHTLQGDYELLLGKVLEEVDVGMLEDIIPAVRERRESLKY